MSIKFERPQKTAGRCFATTWHEDQTKMLQEQHRSSTEHSLTYDTHNSL